MWRISDMWQILDFLLYPEILGEFKADTQTGLSLSESHVIVNLEFK